MVEVDDLTVVAQDYLKVIWTATERDEPPITTTGLAARLGTSAPNVSETLRRLAGQGLVTYEPYRPVRLTAAGERLAIGMVRRHRLIEAFLVQVLGYGWDEVHEEAERLEHAVSDQLLGRIDALLGHPSRDPHGHQIPTAAGALPLQQRRQDARECVQSGDDIECGRAKLDRRPVALAGNTHITADCLDREIEGTFFGVGTVVAEARQRAEDDA